MMTAMPRIELQQPVEVSRAMFGMAKRPRKISRLQRPEKHHPPLMKRLEQLQRKPNGRCARVEQLSPQMFFVRLDRRLVFGEGKPEPNVRIDVAVRQMMDNLPHRPALPLGTAYPVVFLSTLARLLSLQPVYRRFD